MSLAVEAVSSSCNNMGFDETKDGADKNVISGTIVSSSNNNNNNRDSEDAVCDEGKKLTRQASESSNYATEDEEEEGRMIELGPQCTLKEQLEKDKEDESLRRWKEQLLGSVDLSSVGEILEPDVKILSLAILSPGRPEILLQIPEVGNPKGLWFTLKEGSHYSLKFTFKVSNNIVSGLRYTNQVWKSGIKLIKADEMLGAFSPQAEPFTHQMPEETTPSGIFARGTYSARTKFVDDDKKCYLEINYTFDIRKDWA